jgi:hypothetical protein
MRGDITAERLGESNRRECNMSQGCSLHSDDLLNSSLPEFGKIV